MTNSSESTGTFRKRITSADASNIVGILDMLIINSQYSQFEEDFILGFAGMLESLQVSVGLWSLRPADFPNITPLMSESQKQAELYRIRDIGQKMSISLHIAKGNGPWEYVSECVLQNQGNNESYVPLLVPFLTTNEVLLLDRDFRLGVRIESKWQGPLKSGDYLVISGSWRQRITFSEKKNTNSLMVSPPLVVGNGNRSLVSVGSSQSTIILMPNSNRASYQIYNDSVNTVFIAHNSEVNTVSYEFPLPGGCFWYRDPAEPRYYGSVSAIAASGSASLKITEFNFAN